ncbi:MAG: hydroxymethylglutaryl-CoA lyase, partial [Aestuariibacter sp.]|nr:hydroxymethylglutaryl-CoA lyase [Aestuariibacter sp.]
MNLPAKVRIVEVGPRDGLQNEAQNVPVVVKVKLVEMLVEAGLTSIEAGAFVSPQWVPQMAASNEVYQQINKAPAVSYPMLVPNMRGLEQAMACDVKEIALFAAATETFSQKNTNCSIDESIERFTEVITHAQQESMQVRGYISCA